MTDIPQETDRLQLRRTVASAASAATTAAGWIEDWAGADRAQRWIQEARDVSGARAVNSLDEAIRKLTAVRDAVAAVVGAWYPVPLTKEIEAKAEEIADYCLGPDAPSGCSFDTAVEFVLTRVPHGFSVDQLTTAIMHARELCTEHGYMTTTTAAGKSAAAVNGGTALTRAHDARTAGSLCDTPRNL
ncbi:hypothetical protein [Crossiella sp. CA198]|uniref:hypothetical protein n=1 Tax=Crossiella sp. CA198 TaxID=3455607 RepID=UPI003F8D032B